LIIKKKFVTMHGNMNVKFGAYCFTMNLGLC